MIGIADWQDRPSNASLIDEPERLPEPPQGHVWVEWVGEASALDNPVVRYNMITGKYTREQMEIIREISRRRIARTHRHRRSIRRGNGEGQIPTLGVERVVFGPNIRARPGQRGSFIQAVPFRAADAIKASDCGHEFIIHNERDGEQQSKLRLPDGTIRIVRRDTFKNIDQLRRAIR
ncbi:hypothetical protein [Microbacterium sp.]|uniref:hypothetical protein n=1 Tax=Microbacterium sp. TaxID=51671 RepID=UPI002616483E|nr:hypothetical protein [Microbacterium sp.]